MSDIETRDDQYRILKGNLPILDKHLAKISKRGAKIGTGPVTYKVVGEEIVKVTEFKNGKTVETGEIKVWCTIELVGETPKIAGWTFQATIDHMHSEPVIRLVPGYDIPEKFQSSISANCDHCNKIRSRKETFVLFNEEKGWWKQVGRSCLRDFFGHDPKGVARYMQYLGDLGTWIGNCGGGNGISYDGYDLDTYLKFVAACIDEKGWVSKSKAYDNNEKMDFYDDTSHGTWLTATADLAWSEIQNRRRPPRGWTPIDVTEKHIETAKAAIEYATKLEDTSGNEYLNTIRVIAKDGYFSARKESGFAASIVSAYLRETEWAAKKKLAAKAAKISKYIGEKGDKIETKVTVNWVKSIHSNWGGVDLHTMTDEDGNILVWFASGKGFAKGDEIKIRAKIKGHKEYNGTKQTLVNYVKEIA